jgi:hypothetical protein
MERNALQEAPELENGVRRLDVVERRLVREAEWNAIIPRHLRERKWPSPEDRRHSEHTRSSRRAGAWLATWSSSGPPMSPASAA